LTSYNTGSEHPGGQDTWPFHFRTFLGSDS
jgi:hypothetical protein